MNRQMITGTCPLPECGQEGINARHFGIVHQLRVTNFFFASGSKGHQGMRSRYYCRGKKESSCKFGFDGPHEAMNHLVEAHPEAFSGEREGEMEQGNDLVTIANLVDRLVEKRLAAEEGKAETEKSLQHLQEQYAEERQALNQRIEDLERTKGTLSEQLRLAREDNGRLSKSAQGLNDDLQRLKRGVLSEKGRHALMELNR